MVGRNDRIFSGLAFGAFAAFFGGADWWVIGLLWALPIFVGGLVGIAVVGAQDVWEGKGSIAVPAWRITGLLAGLVPLTAAIVTSSGVLAIVGGAAIAVMCGLQCWAYLKLTRHVALRLWRAETVYGAIAFLLGLGPFGDWLVRWVPDVPWLPLVVTVVVPFIFGRGMARLSASPGARASYDQLRDRGAGHSAVLRQLAKRLVGILHGCLKTRTLYDEATAWPTTPNEDQQVVAR